MPLQATTEAAAETAGHQRDYLPAQAIDLAQ
jgi:hypothetical protein